MYLEMTHNNSKGEVVQFTINSISSAFAMHVGEKHRYISFITLLHWNDQVRVEFDEERRQRSK